MPLRELELETKHALPFSGMAIENVPVDKPLVVADVSQHVVPLPLIDKIVAISGVGRRPDPKYWYYKSDLREAWAIYELQKADESAACGRFADAANHYAEVFGTLMPGVLCNKSTEQESVCAERAWKGITFFIEPKMLMEKLKEAAHVKFSASEEASGIKTLGDAIAVAQNKFFSPKIGPSQLRIAEQLRDVEEEIMSLEDAIRRPKNSYTFFDMKDMKAGVVLFMLLSDIVKYTAWCWNFTSREPQLVALSRSFVTFAERQPPQSAIEVVRDFSGFFYRSCPKQELSEHQKQQVNMLPTNVFDIRKEIEKHKKDIATLGYLRHKKTKLMIDLGVDGEA
jgi:hypothetical protein